MHTIHHAKSNVIPEINNFHVIKYHFDKELDSYTCYLSSTNDITSIAICL